VIKELVSEKVVYMDQLQQNPQNNTIPSAHPSRIYIVIGAIFLLVLGAGVWRYFSSEIQPQESKKKTAPQDETANWNAKTDNRLGVEFKYPPDWNVDGPLLGERGQGDFYLVMYPSSGEPNMSVDLYKDRTFDEDLYNDFRKGKINIADAYGIIYTNQVDNYVVAIVLHYNSGATIKFSVGPLKYNSDLLNENSIVRKIISTFRVIDKTIDWKIYRNEFYGFEFRYPGEYKVYERGSLGENEAKFPMSNVIFVQTSQRADGSADYVFGIIVPDREFIKKSGEDYMHFITKPGVCGKNDPNSQSQISSESIGIGSYSGKKITEVFPTEYPNRQTFQVFYCIAHSQNPLIIFTPQGSEVGRQDDDQDYKTFEKIFSTFKFIESKTTHD